MACHVCGRNDVRKRPRSGKKHYPHKCPHGVWCVTGDRLLGAHANNVPVAGRNHCDECAAVHRARRVTTKLPQPGELRDRAILGGEPSL